jgi:probable HAF family extracellular repeat protein
MKWIASAVVRLLAGMIGISLGAKRFRRSPRTVALWLAISLLLAARSAWAAAPSYTLTDLGAGVANDINNSGQVTGYLGSGYGFLYSQGTMKALGALGGAYSYGNALNDDGQVVGQVQP